MASPAFVLDAYGTLYDVQSVAASTDAAFPGLGDLITQVWRLKQLEYSWLRSMMGEFRDFWVVTEEALRYTLRVAGVEASPAMVAHMRDAWLQLEPYADARDTLTALAGNHRAILSNGSQAMLDTLVRNTGFESLLDTVISVDACAAFKPSRAAYALVEERLGVLPGDTVFVSANPFDVAGAKRFGFKVVWIERTTEGALHSEIREAASIGSGTLFKILRTRPEELGYMPDWRVASLWEAAQLAMAGDMEV